jgi:xylulokinase
MIAMSNGGAVVEWYRRVFAGVNTAQQEAADQSRGLSGLPEGVEDVPPGSRGILVLPHLIGAAGIHMQPEYSGCILGLRHGTGRAEIFRAILEAVAYEVRWGLDVLAELGVQTPALRMVGGATRSPIWPQIIADVTGLTVSIPHQTECAVLGAARLAQEAVGITDLGSPVADSIVRSYVPDVQARIIYDEYYALYQLTHRALQEPLARLTHASRQ